MYRGLSPTMLALLPNWAVCHITLFVSFFWLWLIQCFSSFALTFMPLEACFYIFFYSCFFLPLPKGTKSLVVYLIFLCPVSRKINSMRNDPVIQFLQVYFTIYEQLKSYLGADGQFITYFSNEKVFILSFDKNM